MFARIYNKQNIFPYSRFRRVTPGAGQTCLSPIPGGSGKKPFGRLPFLSNWSSVFSDIPALVTKYQSCGKINDGLLNLLGIGEVKIPSNHLFINFLMSVRFMKNFFDYDLNNPRERQERFEQYPELSKFDIALSEELSQDEYEEFCEAEKQSYNSSHGYSSSQKKSPTPNKWIR